MKISCSICRDVFIPHSEVCMASCGHVFHDGCMSQWFKQQHTCPHCRAKLGNGKTQRIYFNIEDDTDNDASSLQYRIDQMAYKLHLKKAEVNQLNEKLVSTETINSKLKAHALDLESQAAKQKDILLTLKEEIRYLLKGKTECDEWKSKYEEAKNKLITLKNVETIIHGTVKDVNALVEVTAVSPLSVRQLCTYVEVLKKQGTKLDMKMNDLRMDVKALKMEINRLKSEKDVLNKGLDSVTHAKTKVEEELEYYKQQLMVAQKDGCREDCKENPGSKSDILTMKTKNWLSRNKLREDSMDLSPVGLPSKTPLQGKNREILDDPMDFSPRSKKYLNMAASDKASKTSFSWNTKHINNLEKKSVTALCKSDNMNWLQRKRMTINLDEDDFVSDGLGGCKKRSLATPTPQGELKVVFFKKAEQQKQERRNRLKMSSALGRAPDSTLDSSMIDLT